MGEFSGKVVVVTGGSRGIGRSIAQSFAREGAQTVLAASSQQNLDAAAGAIGNSGPKPLTFAGDLKKLEVCEGLHAFVQDKLGRCDVLVNNAGATRSGNFLELPDEAFRKQSMDKDGLRRIGQPEDVAELALFLCTERARHIQGAAIGVDGGQTTGLF